MKKLKQLICTVILLTGLSFPAMANHGEPPVPPAKDEILMKVNGLVCDFCARAVEKVFMKQDGVDAINVDLDHMLIRVHFLPEKTMEDEKLTTLINDSGYTLVEIIRPQA